MAEILKPSDLNKIWASAGDVLAPSDSKIATGWQVEIPPRQYFNYIDNKQDQAIAHINQHGIAVWDSNTEYQWSLSGTKSICMGSNGTIYRTKQLNINQNPVLDTPNTYWEVAFANVSDFYSKVQADARYLQKTTNLSDLTNTATARTNLSVYSKVEIDSRIKPSTGVVGLSRNLSASLASPSSSLTLVADEIVVENGAFGSGQYLLTFLNRTVNLSTLGVGGMDVGTAPISGFVGIYLIYNPSLANSATNPALLAQNATSGALGNLYGGTNMPAGYTASALVSVWQTNASGLMTIGYQINRTINTPTITLVNNGQATAYTSFSLSAAIPANAKTFNGQLAAQGASSTSVYISALSTPLAEKRVGGYTGAGVQPPAAPFFDQPIIVSQTAYYYQIGTNANGIQVYSTGYTF